MVYRRDCRRPFASDDHWLVREVKSSTVIAELERGKKSAQVSPLPLKLFPENRVTITEVFVPSYKSFPVNYRKQKSMEQEITWVLFNGSS